MPKTALARFLHTGSQSRESEMQSPILARLIRRLLLPLLAAFVGVGANAAVFVKRWDPEFNTAFSGLVGTDIGWSGEAFISIEGDCLTGGTILVGTGACSDSEAELVNGTLRFYNMSTNQTLLDLAWDQDDLGSADIRLVRSDGTSPTGIFTLPPIEFDNQLLSGVGVNKVVDIDLVFVFFPEWLNSYSGPLLTLTTDVCKPSWHGYTKCSEKVFTSSIDPSDPNTPNVTPWTRVPEPGTLALVGLALAAGGWVRRRIEVSKQ